MLNGQNSRDISELTQLVSNLGQNIVVNSTIFETWWWATELSEGSKKIAVISSFYIGKACFEHFYITPDNMQLFSTILIESLRYKILDVDKKKAQENPGKLRVSDAERKQIHRHAENCAQYAMLTVGKCLIKA